MESHDGYPFEIRDEYKWDVFISYKRGRLLQEWLRESFEIELRKRLDDHLGGRSRIFVDYSLDEGCIPEIDVLENLFHSRCLVPIIGSPYFESKWCSAEWKTFDGRDRMSRKVRSVLGGNVIELYRIFPVIWSSLDGDESIYNQCGRVCFSFEDYRLVEGCLKRSKKFEYFQIQTDKLSRNIYALIKAKDNLNKGWPLVRPMNCTPLACSDDNILPNL